MGKANRLKPIHTGGTTSITTRRKPEDELTGWDIAYRDLSAGLSGC
jgi:hypothetical protein